MGLPRWLTARFQRGLAGGLVGRLSRRLSGGFGRVAGGLLRWLSRGLTSGYLQEKRGKEGGKRVVSEGFFKLNFKTLQIVEVLLV